MKARIFGAAMGFRSPRGFLLVSFVALAKKFKENRGFAAHGRKGRDPFIRIYWLVL
jgi:hypothetical protein